MGRRTPPYTIQNTIHRAHNKSNDLSDAKRSFLSSTTSFSNVVTLLLNWKTNAKSRSVDRGFVASVVGGGMDVDCCGRGVKDGNDCGMKMENTGEESEITKTAFVWGISEKFKNLVTKSDE
ncbi:hypothetical protein Tco_1438914 [Tanacetum coccineum]